MDVVKCSMLDAVLFPIHTRMFGLGRAESRAED